MPLKKSNGHLCFRKIIEGQEEKGQEKIIITSLQAGKVIQARNEYLF